jgi:hypothetical protein
MSPHVSSSPISLSYVTALRGVKPRCPGKAFAYIDIGCQAADLLACLAASNPEGQFFGLVVDEAARKQAQDQAALRGVKNITFMSGTPSSAKAQLDVDPSFLPQFDYICCDESQTSLIDVEREAVFPLLRTAEAWGLIKLYLPRIRNRRWASSLSS